MAGALAAQLDPVRSALVAEFQRRGVTPADAENFTQSFAPEAIRQQLQNFDRQRINQQIKNPGAWFQSALTRGYQPPPEPVTEVPAVPAYSSQNEHNRKVRVECNATERRFDQVKIMLATAEPRERRRLLREALHRDEEMALNSYRRQKHSLWSELKRVRDAGRDPYTSHRLLSLVAELLEVKS
ncbi:MAG TPA: hypothetical protein VGJ21_16205 [Terracidiphilus sp.]